MKFDELDTKMRVFETAADYCVLPGIYMVARLDGRSFTRLTKDICQFQAPFDERFRDLMLTTAESLMTCGFRVLYAYTESDEISLLLSPHENVFGRKLRKYNSTLAGEASARFSLSLGRMATFDCRISQLPTKALVVDYFRWRSEDAARNSLNAYCYWTLRRDGLSEREATAQTAGHSLAAKNELLFERGINFNDVPQWQKRGVGLYWRDFEKTSQNPITGEKVVALRRRVERNLELPMKEAYNDFVLEILAKESPLDSSKAS
ncbi:tRNA(His) guanylyltransferase Thg1 family protein [Anatilimnocola sp. NA78]|uniref:tRNA(His) guanylyltransferase Thg1 family protein n=1 Tax=Anatilimnocola sp. NA78 TaxID=3415683 RepID=UPI003CE4C654